MSFASFISARITFKSKRTFSKLIVRIAIIGIMLGLGVMILSLAIVKGFKHEIRNKVRGFAGDIRVVKFDLNNSYQSSSFPADSEFVKRALKSPFITHVMPVATKPGIVKANNEIEGVVLKGVDKNYDWSYFKKMMVAGEVISFADSVEAQKEIMISQTTADRLKLKVGDKLLMYFVEDDLRRRQFKIKGIFNIGVEEVDKTFVIGALSLINRLNNWKPNEIGQYELRVADFDHINEAAYALETVLPVKLKEYTIEEDYPTIFEWLNLLDVNSVVMLVLMVAVAVINMISALLIMILERTAMIGMLKAMGASNWAIRKIFLINASYLIGLGLLLGNLLGIGLGYFQMYTHFFQLDQASYYMTFVPVEFNIFDIVVLNIGTLIICLLVLIIPSTLVSRISPVKAIQFK
ncbi:ABC transporter permease [Mucilaginibacter rubeus]|uniref:ABC transporter permease n=1 Tax=Mucilaginibacter rubeus TaxID=2027860 RepID=A0AAE6JAY2_9SPHI|nr:ABC transporter permease [Mucilaginibacter rubeus]QEM14842.1 ABC transporter permease [Mucilaginibacter gossypii]QEM02216.1 ABC transporter permease [Mucilaginibacter rubeus]QTE42446.1 ABC transporter permease [Mucilaginibacter rubeus]QTE49049.1 ABC transporter permease [Mucilaginibacter rubeus]QTE54147.1 ABC transporter permease [Mucilaginibacter rubeus]